MTICTSKSRNIWFDEFVAVLLIKMTVDSIIFRLESKYFFFRIDFTSKDWKSGMICARCRNVNLFELKMERLKTEVCGKRRSLLRLKSTNFLSVALVHIMLWIIWWTCIAGRMSTTIVLSVLLIRVAFPLYLVYALQQNPSIGIIQTAIQFKYSYT